MRAYSHLGLPHWASARAATAAGWNTSISTYNDATVDYGDGALTTDEYPHRCGDLVLERLRVAGSPANFQEFLTDNDSTGILGIGDSTSDGGPTESPLQADGYNGVTVDMPNVPTALDEPDGDLIVSPTNPGTAIATLSGAPIVHRPDRNRHRRWYDGRFRSGLRRPRFRRCLRHHPVIHRLQPPSRRETRSTVSDGSTVLYSYTVGTDTPDGTSEAPEVGTGIGTSASPIDSGIEPFFGHPIYIDYANDTRLGYVQLAPV